MTLVVQPLSVTAHTLQYALRHALSRPYSIDVAEDVKANRDRLKPDDRRQIVQDIEAAITDGTIVDERRWLEVARALA